MEPETDSSPTVKAEIVRHGTGTPNGGKLVVSVGSDISSAFLLPSGEVVTSKGGHITWQPMDGLELEILRSLWRNERPGPFSVASLIGGRHMWRLYIMLKHTSPIEPSLAIRDAVQKRFDESTGIGPLITEGALQGDPFCEQFMEVYAHILGQWWGNLALTLPSTGGIFLTGGVLTEEVTRYLFAKGPLLEAFLGNPAQEALLQAMPIYRIDPCVSVEDALNLARI